MVNSAPISAWAGMENGGRTGWPLSKHVAPAAGKQEGHLSGHKKGMFLSIGSCSLARHQGNSVQNTIRTDQSG